MGRYCRIEPIAQEGFQNTYPQPFKPLSPYVPMWKELLIYDENKNPSKKYYDKLNKEDKVLVDKFEDFLKLTAGKNRSKKGNELSGNCC